MADRFDPQAAAERLINMMTLGRRQDEDDAAFVNAMLQERGYTTADVLDRMPERSRTEGMFRAKELPRVADIARQSQRGMLTPEQVRAGYAETPRDVLSGVDPTFGYLPEAQSLAGKAIASVPSEAMLAANFLIPGAKALPRVPNPIKAYHGSPHDFDKFDLSKIGTGEGAQAYGHGLYFAENEGVARSYRDTLGSFERPADVPKHVWGALDRTMANYYSRLPTAAERKSTAQHLLVPARSGYRNDWEMKAGAARLSPQETKRRVDALEWLAANPHVELQPPGRMYEVALHATPEQFLDWDKPLGGQSPKVREALAAWNTNGSRALPANEQFGRGGADLSDYLLKGLDRAAFSAHMADSGVPGMRYFDQMSRSGKEGTRNAVVWSPEIIEIIRKYGIAGAATILGLSEADVADAFTQSQPQRGAQDAPENYMTRSR